MTTLSIAEVIKTLRDLPSLPLVVIELLSNLDQEDTNIHVLAEKVSRDQALTAKTLRLANSSFYGMQSKVTTMQQAIAILGFNSVRTLVTAAAVIGSFSQSEHPDFDFQAFWRHSIAAALCAKALARQLRANQDHAFIVGLLHDIGRLVLVTRSPKHYAEVAAYQSAHDCSMLDAERAVLQIDHATIGRALAEHWKFPALLQKAIENHHTPDGGDPASLATIVHVADGIVHALDLSGSEHDVVPVVSAAAWNGLKLEQEVLAQVFRETEMQFEEACQILVSTQEK